MKKIIFVMVMLLLLTSCMSKQGCKNIALKEAREWQDLGYNEGLNDGLDFCDENMKKTLEQFNPNENCVIILLGNNMMREVCKGDRYYDEIK